MKNSSLKVSLMVAIGLLVGVLIGGFLVAWENTTLKMEEDQGEHQAEVADLNNALMKQAGKIEFLEEKLEEEN